MNDFTTLLEAASNLPVDERSLLIDALVVGLPDETDTTLHPEWEQEIARRLAQLEAGAETVAWEVVRDEARRKFFPPNSP